MSDHVSCRSCGGSGERWMLADWYDDESGYELVSCDRCGGSGLVTVFDLELEIRRRDELIRSYRPSMAYESVKRAVEEFERLVSSGEIQLVCSTDTTRKNALGARKK